MDNSLYEDYRDMVKQVSSEYSRKYKMVERDDIEQQLWLWFAEHTNKIEEWKQLEERKETDKLFAKSLRNAALDYCTKEKAYKSGYDPSDNFFYNKQFVKLMIPAVLSDDWTKLNNALSTMGRTTKSLAESGDWMAFSADIKIAYEKLSKREQDLVFLFYGEQIDGNELRERTESDKSEKAVMMEANRAVNKIVRYLGGTPAYKDEDYEYGESNDLPELS
jgi:vacuolar-type H+-ATPase subunit I/STV1